MASSRRYGEALTEPMPVVDWTPSKGEAQRKKTDRPEERAVLIDAVVGVGMMRSVCAISREPLRGLDPVFRPQGRSAGPEGVRVSIVAMKRVMTVEPRDTGRWKWIRNSRVKTAR
jgi:hypothetical protein